MLLKQVVDDFIFTSLVNTTKSRRDALDALDWNFGAVFAKPHDANLLSAYKYLKPDTQRLALGI